MTMIRSSIGLGGMEFRMVPSLLCLSVCSVSVIAGVLEPEIKALRTGSLDHHRLELGALNKSPTSTSLHHCSPSTSSAAVHPLAGSSNLGSGSKFGSIRNIKVSATLIRAVHYPRNSREQVVWEYFGRPLNRFLPPPRYRELRGGGRSTWQW